MIRKMTTIGICMWVIFILQGCAAAIIGTTAGIAAAGVTSIVTDSRTTGVQLDDSTLYSRAKLKLYDNSKLLKGARINLTTYSGNILLTGQANNQQIEKIESAMKEIKGVGKIYNQMTNDKPIGAGRIINDFWITTKIKSQLLAKTGAQSLKIKVVTEDGKAYLIGNVTQYTGKMLAEITSKVYGVKHVMTIFNYIDQKDII